MSNQGWAARPGRVLQGDRVAYARAFLKSLRALTGDLAQARGRVAGFERVGDLLLAVIDVEGEAWMPRLVNVSNLCRVTRRGCLDLE